MNFQKEHHGFASAFGSGKDGKGKDSKGKDGKGKKGEKGKDGKGKSSGKSGKGDGKPKTGKGSSNREPSKAKKTDVCRNCGKKGHWARDCWRPAKQASAVQEQTYSGVSSGSQVQAPNPKATAIQPTTKGDVGKGERQSQQKGVRTFLEGSYFAMSNFAVDNFAMPAVSASGWPSSSPSGLGSAHGGRRAGRVVGSLAPATGTNSARGGANNYASSEEATDSLGSQGASQGRSDCSATPWRKLSYEDGEPAVHGSYLLPRDPSCHSSSAAAAWTGESGQSHSGTTATASAFSKLQLAGTETVATPPAPVAPPLKPAPAVPKPTQAWQYNIPEPPPVPRFSRSDSRDP